MSSSSCSCNGHKTETATSKSNFYSSHFMPRGWNLRYYHSLTKEPSALLYLTGRCKDCYDDMEEQIILPETKTFEALLKEIYEAMQRVHPYDEKTEIAGKGPFYYGECDSRSDWYRCRDIQPLYERNKEFLGLFHDYDRPKVRHWLEEYHPTQAHDEVLRDTGGELFCSVIQNAKESGDMEKFCEIQEYILPNENEEMVREHTELTRYEFDFMPIVNFGGSEGIYIDCYLRGCFDDSGRSSLKVGVLKTLRTDLDACKIMGELCGTLMHHASCYVNQNIHRYTPMGELKEEARRMAASEKNP